MGRNIQWSSSLDLGHNAVGDRAGASAASTQYSLRLLAHGGPRLVPGVLMLKVSLSNRRFGDGWGVPVFMDIRYKHVFALGSGTDWGRGNVLQPFMKRGPEE